MTTLSPQNSQKLFIASVVMMIVAVTLSIFNTAQVLSAPLRTNVSVPSTVGFEGFLAQSTGQPIANGIYSLTFRVFDVPTGGSAYWTETQNAVQVTNGLYSVVLGAATPFTSTTFNGTRYIGVTVGTNAEIAPRTQVSSVPFSLNADNSNKIGGGTVINGTTSMIALFDGACPSGWTNYTAAQGRVVVGVSTNGALGATVGIALGDQENRPVGQHSHIVDPPSTTSGPGGTHPGHSDSGDPLNGNGAADGDANRAVINNHSHTVDIAPFNSGDAGSVPGTNAPYIQLRYCKLNP